MKKKKKNQNVIFCSCDWYFKGYTITRQMVHMKYDALFSRKKKEFSMLSNAVVKNIMPYFQGKKKEFSMLSNAVVIKYALFQGKKEFSMLSNADVIGYFEGYIIYNCCLIWGNKIIS